MKKKVRMCLIILCMCFGLLCSDATVWAATGKTSVAVSANSVNIGDTVTVTGKASGASGEKVLATMTLSWDPNVLQFVSCSVDSNGGGGSRLVNGDSFTITLKAISAGTSSVSLSATDGVLFDTVESLDSMAGSSASVTVNNAASGNTSGNTDAGANATAGNNTTGNGTQGGATAGNNAASETLSADNSLKSLSISPGTLSPSFAYNKTSYTATVGADVSNIAVSATPANSKAVVQSVTGNDNLKEGTNNIQIVVKAENGVTATYTIKVTKQAAGDSASNSESEEKPEPTDESQTQETIMVNGIAYQISENFSEEDIPVDFIESTINYHGNQYRGVSYTKSALNLLWLTPQNTAVDMNAKFFVYDETRDNVYSFVKFTNGEKYVIALAAPVDFSVPEYYSQTNLAVDAENTLAAYQKMPESESEIVSEFYVFYGVNHEGTENWYQYDALEGTFQRLSVVLGEDGNSASSEDMNYLQEEYTSLSEKYATEKSFARTMIAVLVFLIAVLIIVIVNLLLHRFRNRDDEYFDDEEDDEMPEENEGEDVTDERIMNVDTQDADIADEKIVVEETSEEVQHDNEWFEEESEEEIESETLKKEEKKRFFVQKKEKTKVADDIEIIDFNDL